MRPRRFTCKSRDGCIEHDHGDCRICHVPLADRVAMSYDGAIWLCEACYSTVRDDVDRALDEAVRDLP